VLLDIEHHQPLRSALGGRELLSAGFALCEDANLDADLVGGCGEMDVCGRSVSAAWLERDAPTKLASDRSDEELRAYAGCER
jgi:hypothetical protein